jgi:hypothetical protein
MEKINNIDRIKQLINNKRVSICPSNQYGLNLHQSVIVKFTENEDRICLCDFEGRTIASMYGLYFEDKHLKIVYHNNGDLYQIEIGDYIFLCISEESYDEPLKS